MGETQAADVSYDTTLSFGYARTGLIDPGSTVLIAGSTLTVDYDPLRIVTREPALRVRAFFPRRHSAHLDQRERSPQRR